MNEWKNELMDEWTNEWMYACTNEEMDEWMNKWINDIEEESNKVTCVELSVVVAYNRFSLPAVVAESSIKTCGEYTSTV